MGLPGRMKRRGVNKRCILLPAVLLFLLPLAACRENSVEAGESNETVKNKEQENNEEQAASSAQDPVFSDPVLLQALTDLPDEIRRQIEERPAYFIQLVTTFLKGPEDYYILVDKSHPLPASYYPDDLVQLDKHPFVLNKQGLTLRRGVVPDLLAMAESARAEGISLPISSTFRSYEYQEKVFQYNVEQLGEQQAKRESAEPGKSQHQLGTTIDFGSITPAFADTEAGKWLEEYAGEYGFSLSYPEGFEDITGYMHESWHYRYIGRTGTRLEREFFSGIQQYMLEFIHEIRENGTSFSGGQ